MALTAAGAALTERQRLDQVRLRTLTVRDLLRLWPSFNPKEISKSWTALEPVLVAMIQQRQPLSSRIAGRYLAEYSAAETGVGITAKTAPLLTLDQLIPNLRIVGPANAHRLARAGRSDIARTTFTNVAGEVGRQILNGGRQTIVDTVQHDRRARGWSRDTSGAPCSFCAMIAGRGPVYRSEDSAAFEAHGNCACTAEPIYFDEAPLTPSAQRYDALYRQVASSVPRSTPDWSAEVRREFRRQYEAAPTT